MFKTIRIFAVFFLLGSCQSKPQDNQISEAEDPEEYCFQSIFPADPPTGRQDVTELWWQETEDGGISGYYNRTPHEKDSRKGTFTGRREADPIDGFVVHATYTYQQEGTQTEEKINIIVRKDQAVILPEGESVWVNGVAYPRDFSLSDTLKQVECAKIKGRQNP